MALSTDPQKLNEILKLNRDRKRASLQMAHQDTRISVAFLQALEAGEYEKFPAEVYCLGFLRKYASYLGLNPDEMVALYKSEQAGLVEVHKEEEKKQIEEDKQEKSSDLIKVLTLILLLVFAGGGWLFTVLHSAFKSKVSEPAYSEAHPAVSPLPPTHENLTLAAYARENVWLRIMLDNQLAFEGFIPGGSTRTWEARNQIFVRAGNTQVLSLTLNDQPVDIRSGAVKDINELVLTKESLAKKSLPALPPPAPKTQ